MYIYIVVLLLLLTLTYYLVINSRVFGRLPTGARLQKIKQLPIYAHGAINNITFTGITSEGYGYWDVLKAMVKGNTKNKPPGEMPHVKPDFTSAEGTKITWFGHSSYLLQIEQLKVLVDPVFSRSTSPFKFIGNSSYKGTDFIHAADMPEIDVLVISHDHYDHLDIQTIDALKSKVKHFVTSLGVGEHLERWGIPTNRITELSWGENAVVAGLSFTAAGARHFSGRSFKRNQSLWSSFVLQTPQHKIYLGGDSGYDKHFAEIGEKYGPFDLAVIECGQYNEMWSHIHLFPEETAKVAKELKADWLLPVHWGKFSLALHDWDDSIRRVTAEAAKLQQKITTPLMGEAIILGSHYPQKHWWLEVQNKSGRD